MKLGPKRGHQIEAANVRRQALIGLNFVLDDVTDTQPLVKSSSEGEIAWQIEADTTMA
jgi:hypothetical protein